MCCIVDASSSLIFAVAPTVSECGNKDVFVFTTFHRVRRNIFGAKACVIANKRFSMTRINT